jgi:uncharacterized OB-fold protein
MAVAAGLRALRADPQDSVEGVALVTREFPLIKGGNGAVILAGLRLPPTTAFHEVLGGAPDALDAILRIGSGWLVIGSDVEGGAGATAVLTGAGGTELVGEGSLVRSLPVQARDLGGGGSDYEDPRLLRERGVRATFERLGAPDDVAALAGLPARDAKALVGRELPALPTVGASSVGFALARLVEETEGGLVLAAEQASAGLARIRGGGVSVSRDERAAQPPPKLKYSGDAAIGISLAAYDRAFDAKLRLEAGRCTTCGTLSYPQRFRCLACGSEASAEPAPLSRDAEAYSVVTVHVPVPGLVTPYSLVLAELDESGVRLLSRLTGAPPGSVAIGDRGEMVLRRIAVRSGVPDYGYAFRPVHERMEEAA